MTKEDRRDWRTWEGDRFCREFWRGVLRSVTPQQEQILIVISDQTLQPKEIAQILNISHQTVTSQLSKLCKLELVDSIQFTKEAYYHITQPSLIELVQTKKKH
jgi:DNA-binding CsgD family transcriptional regulator